MLGKLFGNVISIWADTTLLEKNCQEPPRFFVNWLYLRSSWNCHQLNVLTSQLYHLLLELHSRKDWSHKAWQLDVGQELDKFQWEAINLQGQKMSSNIALREHYYKVLHRRYRTPQLVLKMFPNCSSNCWRCGSLNANYRHIWWDCHVIKPFWRQIGQEVDRIMGQNIPLTLRIYLLHDLSEIKLSRPKKMLLLNLCIAASLLIASKWKSKEMLHKYQRLGKVRYISLMGKLTAMVWYKQGHDKVFALFKEQWAPFFQYCCQEKWDFIKLVRILDLLWLV